MSNEKNPGGRPRTEIDIEQFEKLCSLLCTIEEIAGWFGCHEDTIRRFCEREYGEKFCEVFKRLSAKGKVSLRRQQFKIAEGGNATMAIWLGKQYLGQRDHQDINMGDTQVVVNIKPASDRNPDELDDFDDVEE